MKTEQKYIPSLDGFRAISITLVFLGHVFHNLPIPGGLGVTIFFFISGYLITTLLLREYGRDGRIDFRSFYERRVLRLAPPLVITLIIGTILVLAGVAQGSLDPMGMLSQILFFYNYWDQGRPLEVIVGTKILWSLSVEEHFYIVFPFILVLSLKYDWKSWWLPAVAVAVLIWRTVKFVWLGASEWQIYALTDTRFDSLLWGCYLAVLMGSNAKIPQFKPSAKWTLLAAGFILLGVSVAVRDPIFRSTLRYTLQGVALLPLFYFAITEPSGLLFRPLNWAWVRQIGVYSYTFYLFHGVFMQIVRRTSWGESDILVMLATALASIAYAAAMYRFVEAPVKQVRARLAAASRRGVERDRAEAEGKA